MLRAHIRRFAPLAWLGMCVASVLGMTRFEDVDPLYGPVVDCAATFERELAPLRSLLPEQGILGYVGPTDDSGCHPMMMAQYSLAPVRLVEVDYDLFRRSLQDRAVEVTPLAPQLVLAWGDEGQRWMRRNPDYVRIAETPSAVLLARAP